MGEIENLTKRLVALEDARAIESLKYRYAELMDKGYDADGLAALFAPEGRWTATGFGDFRGREEIRAFFAAMPQQVEQAQHYVTSPRVSVDTAGRKAVGEFYLLCISRTRHTDPARRERFATLARYVDRFEKVDGDWYFDELRSEIATVFRV